MPRSDGHTLAMPQYSRIAARLRERIEAGELPAHSQLASERALSQEYSVARMTVRQALEILEQEGLIYRRAGVGSFVAERRIGVGVGSFHQEVLRAGRRPGARILRAERTVPSPYVAETLDLEVGEEVLITHRLRLADDQPLALETSHWPAARMPELLENLGEGSLWAVARDMYGLVATRSEARLEAITLDARAAERLAVRKGSPAFLLTRWTYDQRGRCFEYARDVYRGDRAQFNVQLPVSSADGKPGAFFAAPPGESTSSARRLR